MRNIYIALFASTLLISCGGSEDAKEDSFKYLQIMSKLLVFVIPKAVEEHNITINEPIKPPSWFDDVAPREESNKDEF